MRIAVDARYLSAAPSGIGRYSANLIPRVARLAPESEFVVFARADFVPPRDWPPNVVIRLVPHAPLGRGTLLAMGEAIDRERCDLVHFHCPVLPLHFRTPAVVTFHDWQPLTTPDFSGGRPLPVKLAYDTFYRWAYPRAARIARAVVADSEATMRDTLRYVPDAAGKTSVALPGIDPFFLEPAPEADRAAVRARLGFAEPFVFYVGSCRPNKRLPTLFGAFAGLAGSRLVLALARDRFREPRMREIAEAGIADRTLVLDAPGDRELRALYREAGVVSMATCDEGFGFPALEALAQGTPVVIAESGSLPELAGGIASSVQPCDADGLASALDRSLKDRDLIERTRRAGPARAREFDWDRTAAQVSELYK